ncbi:hypothetical protein EB169_04050 [archaeon]|nr:hypothetical protein [archaeon]NDB54985.1 hypothetical protein [archaeon]
MKKYTNYHSSFWLEEHDFDEDIVFSSLSEKSVDTIKKYRLSSARKAIANFVSIATGKNIPVTFATNNSYTDGKSVVISGDIDKAEKFDIGVGLALHEGSHILLSDFEILRNLESRIPNYLFELAATKNLGKWQVIDMVKNLDNIVEDRRIDNFIYKNAPGYREYYLKLYEHYFGDKTIEKGLESDDFKKENCESYMFRLINLMNKKSDLTSLKGLREIYSLLDLKNIDRLKNSNDALLVALDIANVIFNHIDVVESQNNNNQSNGQGESEEGDNGQQQDGDAGDMKGDESETPSSNGPSMNSNADGGESMDSESEGESTEGDSNSTEGKSSNSLSDANLKKLNKIIKQQKEFLDGDVKKKKITKSLENEISSVESQGAEIVHVGEGIHNSKGCDVIVLKNLTKKMLEDDGFGMAYAYNDWKTNKKNLMQVIKSDDFTKAEMMGTIMGKKLQVRNESRNTIFNRQKNGKIDGRMIATLGFDNENVFSQTFVDKFKKANIHLSIDASGSMGGKKWRETMINAIALAKATSMISNLELQITFRYSDNDLPVIVFAYDSRKDSFQKIKSIFPYLRECGTTPEGLTFEAIQKMIVPASNDMDSFFVNISDGEPTFSNKNIQYGGMAACEHTKKQVNKIKANGIGVLSYFVSDGDYYSEGSKIKFKTMYGADAKFININSIGEVTATLNKMFLSK